jgi:membrane associated rhomboid family serine protease
MLEGLQRAFDVEDFPEITFILAVILLAVFLFTNDETVNPIYKSLSNSTCSISCPNTCKYELGNQFCVQTDFSSCSCVYQKLNFYENLLGFIPGRPQIYSLTTYIFVHASFTHVLFNILFLIIAGLALEEAVGRWVYLAVFLAAGYFAAVFDILGRFLSGFYSFANGTCAGPYLHCVNLGGPFIGASGAIFGVMAVASLARPLEKVPTILVILAFLPFIQLFFQYQTSLNYFTSIFISAFVIIIALTIFLLTPNTVPILVAMLVFLFSWMFVILFNTSGDVSNVGHLGGVLGGLIAYFLFGKVKRT